MAGFTTRLRTTGTMRDQGNGSHGVALACAPAAALADAGAPGGVPPLAEARPADGRLPGVLALGGGLCAAGGLGGVGGLGGIGLGGGAALGGGVGRGRPRPRAWLGGGACLPLPLAWAAPALRCAAAWQSGQTLRCWE